MALSPVQLVIDEEIINIARRLFKGMKVNEETLAVDLINHVGPKGHFMLEEHTMKFLKEGELIDTELFERSSRDSWEGKGSKTIEQKAREKAINVLENHTVEPIEPDLYKELKSIVEKADKCLA